MEWEDASKIVLTSIASVGGAGTIILGLSSWLGKIWANRLMETEKQEHRKEIEKYKHDLENIKTSLLRYSDKQFELYSKLWEMLCDIKFSDELSQTELTAENLADYLIKIETTERKIEKSILFIDSNHYTIFCEILGEIKNIRDARLKVHSAYNEIKNADEKDWQKMLDERNFKHTVDKYADALTRFTVLMDGFGKNLRKKLSRSE